MLRESFSAFKRTPELKGISTVPVVLSVTLAVATTEMKDHYIIDNRAHEYFIADRSGNVVLTYEIGDESIKGEEHKTGSSRR